MSDQDKQQAMEAKGASAISLDWIIRLCAIGALAYWSIVLVQPFLTIAAWSVILTVALYPAYERLALTLGGRRRLAAALMTFVCLVIVNRQAAQQIGINLVSGRGFTRSGARNQRLDPHHPH